MNKLTKIAILAFAITLNACTTISPLLITQNPIGTKQGKARAVFLFGIPLDGGDFSTGTAARNGGINKIATVDLKTQNYLGIVIVQQTIVAGE